MVIIPTEKKFDWQHTPLVLISIIVLNVLVFLIYQSGDAFKFQSAFALYQQEQYLEIEWPFFKQYLAEQDETELLNTVTELYQSKRYAEVTIQLISRPDFYRYLRVDRYEYFQQNSKEGWFFNREAINNTVKSTSYYAYGLIPETFNLFKLISYQFLHGDILHLLGNLLFLAVCGFAVEAAIGRWRFLALYFVTGIAGGLLHIAFNMGATTPLVGASGAVSGVMAMYLGAFRLKKIEFFYWILFFVGYFRAPALMILPFYIGNEVFQYLQQSGSQVAFMAHTGGFLSGGLLTAVLVYWRPQMFNQEYIEEDQEANPYQEKLAKVYELIEKYRFAAAKKYLMEMMQEFGSDFQLVLLRYNIEKIDKGAEYHQCVQELLQFKTFNTIEIKKLEKIWKENPDLMGTMEEDSLINIGIKFTKLKDPSSAAGICDRLLDQSSQNPSLRVLAAKISSAFAQNNDFKKKKKYDEVAATIANSGYR